MTTVAIEQELMDRRVGPVALWFGFIGGHVSWTLQLLASYAITSHFCFPHTAPLSAPSASGVWTTTFIVTLVLLGVALWALLVSMRNWRALSPVPLHEWRAAEVDSHHGLGRRYLAFGGVLLDLIFVSLIALNLVGLCTAPLCGH